MDKLRWGVLSTAKIGVELVIPAMQQAQYCDMVGIASRDEARARDTAARLGMLKHYGSYEALLADPDIDAIYNPLPNHLHVEWSVKALEAGKHVLCEKPIGMNVIDTQLLVSAAEGRPNLKVMEAFMYRFHPQWLRAKELIASGVIGDVLTIQTFFSYFNRDPRNIRNIAEAGGGGIMDIGCYPISQARFLLEREPEKVCAMLDIDPEFGVDSHSSVVMDFGSANATFTCSTQMNPYQRVNISGAKGRIEIEIPVNAPSDKPCRLWVQTGNEINEERFQVCNQYGLQGDAFSRAVMDNAPVPTPISDAMNNMRVIDAIKASHNEKSWVNV